MRPIAIAASRYCPLLRSATIAILDTYYCYHIPNHCIVAVDTILDSIAFTDLLGNFVQVAAPDCY
jgi:hypothetical protein